MARFPLLPGGEPAACRHVTVTHDRVTAGFAMALKHTEPSPGGHGHGWEPSRRPRWRNASHGIHSQDLLFLRVPGKEKMPGRPGVVVAVSATLDES